LLQEDSFSADLSDSKMKDGEEDNTEQEKLSDKEADSARNLLEVLVYIAPFFQKLVPLDCMVGIADTEKFLTIVPGKEIRPKVDITGRPVPRQEALYSAMRENRKVEVALPKEVFGFEYKSSAVPVTDKQGNVIGGIGLGVGLGNRERLINLAETVAVSTQETSETVKQLTAAAERLAKYQEALKQLGQEVADEVKKTANILQFIHSVATNSNLLGLNAAIEAARAGEQGRGFAVVADEIRKMADNSEKAVKDIENILSSIHRKTEQMTDQVMQTAAIGQEQLAATEEIFSVMEELAASAQQLEQAASKVVG